MKLYDKHFSSMDVNPGILVKTSGFTKLSINTKYVCRGLISLYVIVCIITIRQCGRQIYM